MDYVNHFLSGFKLSYSIELIMVVTDLWQDQDGEDASILHPLDVLAAFDTTDLASF